MSRYQLMRKNDLVTYVEIDETGAMTRAANVRDNELAPLAYRYTGSGLIKWWRNRAAPISQGRMKELLRKQGLSTTGEYLTANLGLSLTDYYWIRPMDSALRWEDINLFDNDFRESILFAPPAESDGNDPPGYSPNSSLVGDIEKTWIIADGERCVIKGNRTQLSAESINEVIASKIHEMQGFDNYVKYDLIRIKGAKYDYGCICRSFASQKYEFVPAWAIYTSEKKPNHISDMDHLINVSEKHGIDAERFRRDLEYQIMTDFIISGYDRHLNNFGVLRDADTLKFVRMAPIFDSGSAMFAGERLPLSPKDIYDIRTNSMAATERGLIRMVRDPSVIDINKLPPSSYIREMYAKDSQTSEGRVEALVRAYEQKIDMCDMIQQGKDPWAKRS